MQPSTGSSVAERATSYLDAWARKDVRGIAACLHPAVTFKGPMQELKGRDAVMAATERVFGVLKQVENRREFVVGDRAMFAYDFVCVDPIGVCRTAELVRFEDGLVREIELFFDPRPFAALQQAAPTSVRK